jgi:sugar phosphate isomerase/epimerase
MDLTIGASVGPQVDRVGSLPDRFEFVEVAVGEGEVPVADLNLPALRDRLDRAGLGLAVHLPFRQPLATTVDRLDDANEAYLRELLGVCGRLDATVAVVHLDTRQRRHSKRAVARERLPERMCALAAAGADHGVEVVFENVGNVGGTPLSVVGDLAVETDASLCLDVGHAVSEAGDEAVVDFLDRYGDRVRHLHVHDVRGRGDSHIPVGSGEVDYGAVGSALRAVGFDGSVTVEVFTDDPGYLDLSAERFLDAVADPDRRG